LRLVERKVEYLYDLLVSQVGSFRIIDFKIFSPACIWNHIVSKQRIARAAEAMLIVSAAFVALVPTASGSRGPAGPGTALRAAQKGEIAQYHGSNRGQYHDSAASSGQLSARLSGSASPSGELRNAIYVQVISPVFTHHSVFGSKKGQGDSRDSSGAWIGSQNYSSIQPETRNDPRPMLELGVALGLVYIAFLAVWFWTTRFRVRPPRSAPS
jgi:hypothetical protein